MNTMLRTLIVGLGQAGWILHLPVLNRIRKATAEEGLFSPAPIVVFDPCGAPEDRPADFLLSVGSLAEARAVLDPADTVVHLCTPPSARAEVLRELAELGFRKILVEKPLAPDREALTRILAISEAWDLDLAVVSHWLDSALTHQLAKIVYSGGLGELRSVHTMQRKPRFTRSLTTDGHPSAFEVEVPHSLAVVLRLAGDATVVGAEWADMEVDGLKVPRMGAARMVLQHDGGMRTEISSVLTSPMRERRITLELEGGQVSGFYPVSRDDDYALLSVTENGKETISILRDDSLASFLKRTYRGYATGRLNTADLKLNIQLVSLLSDAKHICESSEKRLTGLPGAPDQKVEHVG